MTVETTEESRREIEIIWYHLDLLETVSDITTSSSKYCDEDKSVSYITTWNP
ncbi:hypothetical protein ERO13_D08G105050v2 [Gossypium hirsutum]|uniref:Uncharacterized protein n=1 Tax=Gossypium barbadense TaxID=3634 RepID=A0A5J5QC82_GOSBA|nr:hypothetical protein ES319_D08G111800v1 [Gossypium barbadense]KAG4133612.1 hypothetical protein ERO13_D08G105050v2 [Gossypium hirsutum]